MKILIVDDEPLARERIKDLLRDIGGGHEILEAGNGNETLRITEQDQADVVLLDIRMPGMDGLETAFHLSSLTTTPAIIFTTAYDEHAIKAFEVNAIDYLLKPIRRDRLQQALQRVKKINKEQLSSLDETNLPHTIRQNLNTVNQGKLQLIPIEEISYLLADQKYVSVGWKGQEKLTSESLKSLEAELEHLFLRIHRNALVAISCIDSLEKEGSSQYSLSLRDVDRKFDVSRRHLKDVKNVIKKLG